MLLFGGGYCMPIIRWRLYAPHVL